MNQLSRHKIHTFSLALAIALLISSTPALAAVTYKLVDYPQYQNGWTLSGSITTDGATGDITAGHIKAWDWTITQGNLSFSRDSTNSEAEFWPPLAEQKCFHATSTSLSMIPGWWASLVYSTDPGAADDDLGWNWISLDGGQTMQPYYFCAVDNTYGWAAWNTTLAGPNGWIVATVPEPSTIALLFAASLGGLLWWRRR